MRNVLTDLLWIGNSRDARDLQGVLALDIRAMVDLAYEEPACAVTRDLLYCRFPLSDGTNPPEMIRLAIDTVSGLLNQQVPTLVVCSAGMSRSPAIVAAALAAHTSRSLNECLVDVTKGHPHDVSSALWDEIRRIW